MTFKFVCDGRRHALRILARRPHLVVEIDGRRHVVEQAGDDADGAGRIRIDGEDFAFTRAAQGQSQIVRAGGQTFDIALIDPRSDQESEHAQDEVRAPMPGAVVSVAKAIGDAVARGDTILTIESMKLQTALVSPRDGIIAQLERTAGSTFERDEVLVRLEPRELGGGTDA